MSNIENSLSKLPPLDPEALWIASELASTHCTQRKEQGQHITVRSMAHSYSPAIAKLVVERLGITDAYKMLSDSEACRIGTDALVRSDPEQKLSSLERVELAARYVMNAAEERAKRPPPAPTYMDYWPFGQEGGFCNPHKLDLLDD